MGELLVTGSAGFIGFHLTRRLLQEGRPVTGVDNLNDYYDVGLKRARLEVLEALDGYTHEGVSLEDRDEIGVVFKKSGGFKTVINLAAQPGVRYSLQNPYAYVQSNVAGFLNILECCRHFGTEHLLFASSSSVYGLNTRMPFSTHRTADHPVSLYGATKKSGELMAHAYSHLYGIPTTGLRFFTVYGPWGRPDMAPMIFTKAITEGRPIDVFNHGRMKRDFTYVDDIVEGMVRLMKSPPGPSPDWDASAPDPSASSAPYRLYNIGNNNPVELGRFIEILEAELGMEAKLNMLPAQPGDMEATYADIDDLASVVGFKPSTSLEDGIKEFVKWYREYYGA